MKVPEFVNSHLDGLSESIGITYHSTDDPETLEAHLTCNKNCAQPWGFLSGGATLATAENVAGVGSMILVPGKMVFGINVSANHMSSARIGENVIATARIIRHGRRLHQWLVDVKKEDGTIISEIMVTNYIKEQK